MHRTLLYMKFGFERSLKRTIFPLSSGRTEDIGTYERVKNRTRENPRFGTEEWSEMVFNKFNLQNNKSMKLTSIPVSVLPKETCGWYR